VHLEAGVARLKHHRVVLDQQFVEPLDVKLVCPAPHLLHRPVEGAVARHRGHVLQPQIRFAQGRQDTGQQDLDILLRRQPAQEIEPRFELLLHRRQAAGAEGARIEVDLEIEQAELGGVMRVVNLAEEIHRHGGGMPVVIDEKQLLLGADAAHAALDHPLFDHQAEGAQIDQQVAHEGAPLLAVGRSGDGAFFAHVTLPRGPYRPRAGRRKAVVMG
jgi:hypothetical protein